MNHLFGEPVLLLRQREESFIINDLRRGEKTFLEVGIVDYQDFGSDVPLQVMVRLVDPVTKQVLGKARNWVGPSLVPLPLFLRSAPPEPREQRDKVTRQTLVT